MDSPIKDITTGLLFFPDQHPELRGFLDPGLLALRQPGRAVMGECVEPGAAGRGALLEWLRVLIARRKLPHG